MTTYGVGEMYFINLRKEAEKKLKDRFNIKAFHDNCLQNGTIPLNYLDVLLKNWIEATSNGLDTTDSRVGIFARRATATEKLTLLEDLHNP